MERSGASTAASVPSRKSAAAVVVAAGGLALSAPRRAFASLAVRECPPFHFLSASTTPSQCSACSTRQPVP
eukprot:1493-Heterococcus_DN1.PRE.1